MTMLKVSRWKNLSFPVDMELPNM